jgi:hypothetical protein
VPGGLLALCVAIAAAGEEKVSVFGTYQPVDKEKLERLDTGNKATVESIQATAKKDALKTIAMLPAFSLACFILLILYFRSKKRLQSHSHNRRRIPIRRSEHHNASPSDIRNVRQ